MMIAYLVGNSVDFLEKYTSKNFSTLETLLESQEKWDAIILSDDLVQNFLQNDYVLSALRQHENFCLTPIFTAEKTPLTDLCDGYCQNESQVLTKIADIKARLGKLVTRPQDAKSQFLAYVYSRAPFDIIPGTDWHASTYYYYPLADLFITDNLRTPSFLNELSEKNWLTKNKSLRAQFICTHCESAHLSFTERCPECHHEDIQSNPFLHCFSCGLIAPETEFLEQGRFKCPKCKSLLRHIGEEYDRPLESGECMHCHEYYQEPELWVRCMLCEKDYSPERLAKSNRRIYHVSKTNAMNILEVYFMANLNIFDDIHYMESSFFMALVDWLFSLSQRYSDDAFSLVGFSLKLTPETIPFLHEFAEQLKKILRETDILTRMMEDEIWLLLPKTNEDGLKSVLSRINKAKSDFITQIHWNIAGICSLQISKDTTMEKVMFELRMKWQ